MSFCREASSSLTRKSPSSTSVPSGTISRIAVPAEVRLLTSLLISTFSALSISPGSTNSRTKSLPVTSSKRGWISRSSESSEPVIHQSKDRAPAPARAVSALVDTKPRFLEYENIILIVFNSPRRAS